MTKSIRKENPVISIANGLLIDLPSPSNLSYFWNFGSLLGLCLGVQIITGIFLAMHYCPDVDLAFNSVEHITRDVNLGFVLRYLHANEAVFFLFVYIHIGRGLFYGSFRKLMPWNVGVVIFLLMILTSFLGYVLPWGQMSFWAVTVITNLLSAIPYIGDELVRRVWGGFSVSNATLNRFYSFHYLFPFLLVGLAFVHLIGFIKPIKWIGLMNLLNLKKQSYIAIEDFFLRLFLLSLLIAFTWSLVVHYYLVILYWLIL